jgi:hypothetical protein
MEMKDDFDLFMWAWVVATTWMAFGIYLYLG